MKSAFDSKTVGFLKSVEDILQKATDEVSLQDVSKIRQLRGLIKAFAETGKLTTGTNGACRTQAAIPQIIASEAPNNHLFESAPKPVLSGGAYFVEEFWKKKDGISPKKHDEWVRYVMIAEKAFVQNKIGAPTADSNFEPFVGQLARKPKDFGIDGDLFPCGMEVMRFTFPHLWHSLLTYPVAQPPQHRFELRG